VGGLGFPSGNKFRCDGTYYRGERMNDRTRAMEVLKQAREVLLSRLAERVLDNREDILDDAGGYSYCGAIESMHDQLGQRLSNVTAMLAHLQSADEAPATYDSTSSDVMGTVPEVDAVFGIGLEGLGEVSSPPRKEASPTIRLDSESTGRGHTSTADWEAASIDWSAHSPPAAETEDSGRCDHTVQTEETESHDESVYTPMTGMLMNGPQDESVTVTVETDPADAGCRDHVFQETDFRGVDLLAADFETGLLGSAESKSGDISTGE